MIISTAPFVAGYRVAETKGHVFGVVQARFQSRSHRRTGTRRHV